MTSTEDTAVIVRYRVKEGKGEANAALVRNVYAALAELRPPGFRYATYVLEDGATFVHVAFTEAGAEETLPSLPAFQRFREGLAERCEEQPHLTSLTSQVGSYGFDPARALA